MRVLLEALQTGGYHAPEITIVPGVGSSATTDAQFDGAYPGCLEYAGSPFRPCSRWMTPQSAAAETGINTAEANLGAFHQLRGAVQSDRAGSRGVSITKLLAGSPGSSEGGLHHSEPDLE